MIAYVVLYTLFTSSCPDYMAFYPFSMSVSCGVGRGETFFFTVVGGEVHGILICLHKSIGGEVLLFYHNFGKELLIPIAFRWNG